MITNLFTIILSTQPALNNPVSTTFPISILHTQLSLFFLLIRSLLPIKRKSGNPDLSSGKPRLPEIHCFLHFFAILFFDFWYQYYALHMARLLHLDVECVARFAFIRGNLSKRVFALKYTDFFLCAFSEAGQSACSYLIICKPIDLPTASKLRSDGTIPKSHRLNSNAAGIDIYLCHVPTPARWLYFPPFLSEDQRLWML